MSYLLPYAAAIGAVVPTTLVVLGLWVAHARVVDGYSTDSTLLSFVFLFVTLIFFVSVIANVAAVALGQLIDLLAPGMGGSATILAAGVLVWLLCAWTQGGRVRGPAPVSATPVALFAGSDMLILFGGLSLLPGSNLL